MDRLVSSGSVNVAAIAELVRALADPDVDSTPDATLAQLGFASRRAVRDLAAAVLAEFANEFGDLHIATLSPAMSVNAFAEAMGVALETDKPSELSERSRGAGRTVTGSDERRSLRVDRVG